jgi:hypothetical protein
MRTGFFVLALAAIVLGCVSQAPTTTPSVTSSAGPRFAASGPAAEDYGAGNGYPIGDRRTFYTIPILVGSHSHMDEIFEGRLVRKAGRRGASCAHQPNRRSGGSSRAST